jgi:hypothetical protein
MACNYCKKGFTCGCQKTKANDGSTVHKKCLKTYNETSSGKKQTTLTRDKLTNKLMSARTKR